MIVDSAGRLLSVNAEAVQILSYPETSRNGAAQQRALGLKIEALLDGNAGSVRPDGTSEFVSGRRRYECRTLPLKAEEGSPLRPRAALLFERIEAPRLPASVPERYQLTPREAEVVELLMRGLTSKEIASRLQLSPNTVKSFLRLVMLKMGVGTRSGIVGRLFQSVGQAVVP